jgi:hypothetical protein
MDKLHIVTVATDPKYYFPYLVESCKKNGKELEVLGMGEVWQGFNWKYLKMIEYLKTLPMDDIVCFIDGYDVICCRNLNQLVHQFKEIKKRTGCKLVVAEDKKSTMMTLSVLFFGSCNNNNINSGMYIGYVKDMLEIIQKIYELNPKNDADDQVLMTEYCKKNKEDFYCDVESKLFLSLVYPLEEIDKYMEIDENTHILKYKSSEPFFVHAPGYGYLENVIRKLGYNIDKNKIKNELFWNIIQKKFFLYLKMVILDYYIWILVLICLILFYFNFKYIKISKKRRISKVLK